jgi:hypothetical protein
MRGAVEARLTQLQVELQSERRIQILRAGVRFDDGELGSDDRDDALLLDELAKSSPRRRRTRRKNCGRFDGAVGIRRKMFVPNQNPTNCGELEHGGVGARSV